MPNHRTLVIVRDDQTRLALLPLVKDIVDIETITGSLAGARFNKIIFTFAPEGVLENDAARDFLCRLMPGGEVVNCRGPWS